MLQKRMFRVIAPMDKKDGGTWWLRCGSGFLNRDNSINLYLDALPTAHKPGPLQLQIRELTEEDLAREQSERSQRRSGAGAGNPASSLGGYASRGTLGGGLDPSLGMPAAAASTASSDIPF